MSQYPEHEKLQALNGKNQAVGDFIEWLKENGMCICEETREEGYDLEYAPTMKRTSSLIAVFFDIDEQKLEDEKQEMLEEMRAI